MSTRFPGAGGQGAILSDNMPKLSAGPSRGVNKAAFFFTAVVSIVAIGMTLWVAGSSPSEDELEVRKEVCEELKLPAFFEEVNTEVCVPVSRWVEDYVPHEPLDLEGRWFPRNDGVLPLDNADYTLVKGTFIRCSLETQIVSTTAGNTSCIVTEPIYSVNGSHLLIDRGSKIVGNYQYADENFDRIGVIWSRVLTTTGLDIRIDIQGKDALGGAGVPGAHNGHWGERLGAAMLLSLLADGADVGAQRYANEHNMQGPTNYNSYGRVVGADPCDSATVSTEKKAPSDILEKSANRKATVAAPNGTVVNIFAVRDVDFSSVMR